MGGGHVMDLTGSLGPGSRDLVSSTHEALYISKWFS